MAFQCPRCDERQRSVQILQWQSTWVGGLDGFGTCSQQSSLASKRLIICSLCRQGKQMPCFAHLHVYSDISLVGSPRLSFLHLMSVVSISLMNVMSLSWIYRPQSAYQLVAPSPEWWPIAFEFGRSFSYTLLRRRQLWFSESLPRPGLGPFVCSTFAWQLLHCRSLLRVLLQLLTSVSLMSEDSSTIPWTRCFFFCFSSASSCAFRLPVSLSKSPFSVSRGEVATTTSSSSVPPRDWAAFFHKWCSAGMWYGRHQLISCQIKESLSFDSKLLFDEFLFCVSCSWWIQFFSPLLISL